MSGLMNALGTIEESFSNQRVLITGLGEITIALIDISVHSVNVKYLQRKKGSRKWDG